jgi:hypothetical protein
VLRHGRIAASHRVGLFEQDVVVTLVGDDVRSL